MYDCRFKAMLVNICNFAFGSINHDLYVTVFDSKAVQKDVPHCYRLKSLFDKVVHCPSSDKAQSQPNVHAHTQAVKEVQPVQHLLSQLLLLQVRPGYQPAMNQLSDNSSALPDQQVIHPLLLLVLETTVPHPTHVWCLNPEAFKQGLATHKDI